MSHLAKYLIVHSYDYSLCAMNSRGVLIIGLADTSTAMLIFNISVIGTAYPGS